MRMVIKMYTIAQNFEQETEIKKSRFIGKLFKVRDFSEVEAILSKLRHEYSDATHICYAYRINDGAKFFDDGEPGGTAGLPMMKILNKRDLNLILAVVIRYFGGIKLGSGGLVRAYSSSISELVKERKLLELVEGYQIKITCSYDKSKQLDYLLRDIEDIKKEYLEVVTYQIEVDQEQFQSLQEWNPIIIQKTVIEKDPKTY